MYVCMYLYVMYVYVYIYIYTCPYISLQREPKEKPGPELWDVQVQAESAPKLDLKSPDDLGFRVVLSSV